MIEVITTGDRHEKTSGAVRVGVDDVCGLREELDAESARNERTSAYLFVNSINCLAFMFIMIFTVSICSTVVTANPDKAIVCQIVILIEMTLAMIVPVITLLRHFHRGKR